MNLNSVLLDNGERIVFIGGCHYVIGSGTADEVMRDGESIDEDEPVLSNKIKTTPKELFAHPINHPTHA